MNAGVPVNSNQWIYGSPYYYYLINGKWVLSGKRALKHIQLAVIQNRIGISRIFVRSREGDHLLKSVGNGIQTILSGKNGPTISSERV